MKENFELSFFMASLGSVLGFTTALVESLFTEEANYHIAVYLISGFIISGLTSLIIGILNPSSVSKTLNRLKDYYKDSE